jgi:hypothetical protein
MPYCVPVGTDWMRGMAGPFQDDSIGVVVSQCFASEGSKRGLISRLLDSVSPPEKRSAKPGLLRQDTVSHLCDAYRAGLLADVGYFGGDGLTEAAQPLDISVKVADAGYSIVLSDAAAVTYNMPGSRGRLAGALRKALDYGLADAQLDKLHGLHWLNAGVLAAAFFSLFLLPVAAYNLPLALVLGAVLFVWSAFLSLRLPVLGWEWPLVVGNALAFVAIILLVRRDWWPSFFGKQIHPAIIREWCWLAAITAFNLLVLGETALAGAVGTVRRPVDVLYVMPVFALGLPWRLLVGVGYFFGPLVHPSRKKDRSPSG